MSENHVKREVTGRTFFDLVAATPLRIVFLLTGVMTLIAVGTLVVSLMVAEPGSTITFLGIIENSKPGPDP